ncbi:hypothetical protein Zmor_008470 [Zophobas morio]|uniref:Uncharacterized protein n=1 Tax=Zophobas morio TaxID=2755281 RepID=A0AA38IV52_9CUCU|nr:hypothetical protein Zmor_008470 [Zophobas morio]
MLVVIFEGIGRSKILHIDGPGLKLQLRKNSLRRKDTSISRRFWKNGRSYRKMRPKLTAKIFWKTDFGERNRNIQHIDIPTVSPQLQEN